MSDTNQHSRLDEIGRTLRHAQATRRTETDSWLNGYQEDVAWLLQRLEEFEEQYEDLRHTVGYVEGVLARDPFDETQRQFARELLLKANGRQEPTADAPYWRNEIDRVLGPNPAKRPT